MSLEDRETWSAGTRTSSKFAFADTIGCKLSNVVNVSGYFSWKYVLMALVMMPIGWDGC